MDFTATATAPQRVRALAVWPEGDLTMFFNYFGWFKKYKSC